MKYWVVFFLQVIEGNGPNQATHNVVYYCHKWCLRYAKTYKRSIESKCMYTYCIEDVCKHSTAKS